MVLVDIRTYSEIHKSLQLFQTHKAMYCSIPSFMSREFFRLDEVSKALQLAGSVGRNLRLSSARDQVLHDWFWLSRRNDKLVFAPLTDMLRKCTVLLALKHKVKNKNSQEHGYVPLASPLLCESWYGLQALQTTFGLLCLSNLSTKFNCVALSEFHVK